MRNLAVNIPITLNLNNLVKWKVAQFIDCKDEETPYAIILIDVYGTGTVLYQTYTLTARDVAPSRVLLVNPIPTSFYEQLIVGERLCANAYTNLITAYYDGNVGKRTRLDNLEPVLLSTNLMAAALA